MSGEPGSEILEGPTFSRSQALGLRFGFNFVRDGKLNLFGCPCCRRYNTASDADRGVCHFCGATEGLAHKPELELVEGGQTEAKEPEVCDWLGCSVEATVSLDLKGGAVGQYCERHAEFMREHRGAV